MTDRIRTLRRLTLALFLSLAALALAPSVQGYIGQNPYDVHLSGPGQTVACTQNVVITATVKSATSGRPVGHQTVNWDIKSAQSSGDRLSDSTTSTASDGTTQVTLVFGPETGARVVRATIATFPATITVTCSGPLNVTPTSAPTPIPAPTPTPTQRPPQPTQAAPNPGATGTPSPAPHPAASGLPGTDPVPPTTPGQGPDVSLLLGLVLLGSVVAIVLRRVSRT